MPTASRHNPDVASQLSQTLIQALIKADGSKLRQCGLANLDRCSRAGSASAPFAEDPAILGASASEISGEYMVGGARLKQHVNYNISCNLVIGRGK